MEETEILIADLSDPVHASNYLRLTAMYMADKMGGVAPWTDQQREKVLKDLKVHPSKLILLAKSGDSYVGVCTCFMGYSTFIAKGLINIHDIYVDATWQGKGVGRQLLKGVEEYAREHNLGRITLEVRHDNINAQGLYKSEGYIDGNPPMYFWTKHL